MADAAPATIPADPFTTLRVDFDPKHLPRLAAFMAVHDIRYYLNGVYIEPAPQGGVFLVATDGHTLLAIHDSTGKMAWPGDNEGRPVIVRVTPGAIAAAKVAAAASHRYRREFMGARVLVRGQRLSVAVDSQAAVHDGELFVQAGRCHIEGKYPDWRKMLPAFDTLQRGSAPGHGGAMNANYLARLSKVAPQGRFSFPGVQPWHTPTNEVLTLFQFLSAPEMVALIMGMKGEADLAKLPAFKPAQLPASGSAANDGEAAKAA